MKPILFNTEMVKAILDGRKTQTRRFFNVDIVNIGNDVIDFFDKKGFRRFLSVSEFINKYAKYKVGDVLWIREPAKVTHFLRTGSTSEGDFSEKIWFKYLADGTEDYMEVPDRFAITPNWIINHQGVPNGCIKEMARIFLRVKEVRVERLQDISNEDCLAEGIKWQEPLGMMVDPCDNYSKQEIFEILWNSTAKDGYKWEDNPYIPVYEFERVTNEL